jgi:hypothetical protein
MACAKRHPRAIAKPVSESMLFIAFVFLIGDVPIRLCRQDKRPAPPMQNEANALGRVWKQMRLDFPEETWLHSCALRLELSLDAHHCVRSVLLVLVDTKTEEEVESWHIESYATVAPTEKHHDGTEEMIEKEDAQELEPATFAVVAEEVSDANQSGE